MAILRVWKNVVHDKFIGCAKIRPAGNENCLKNPNTNCNSIRSGQKSNDRAPTSIIFERDIIPFVGCCDIGCTTIGGSGNRRNACCCQSVRTV